MANFLPHQSSSQFLRSNNVLYTGNTTSTPSTTFLPQTRQIRVSTNISGGVYVKPGDASVTATAVTDGMFVAANSFPEYFTVTPGQIIAIISTSTTTGVVTVSEMG